MSFVSSFEKYFTWTPEPQPFILNYTLAKPILKPFWFEKLSYKDVYYHSLSVRKMIIAFTMVYLLFVWIGQKVMKHRPAFQLKRTLVIWNWSLALFSIVSMLRTYPELFSLLANSGFHNAFCLRDGTSEQFLFWSYLVLWSKIVEFGDTVFLVLRKKPVILLHWFHHSTVPYSVFHLAPAAEPTNRATLVNLFIHSIMYTYYALKAMDVKMPRRVSMWITTAQLSQFYFILLVNLYTLYQWASGRNCYRSPDSVVIILVLGIAYVFLFSRYYQQAYQSARKGKKVE